MAHWVWTRDLSVNTRPLLHHWAIVHTWVSIYRQYNRGYCYFKAPLIGFWKVFEVEYFVLFFRHHNVYEISNTLNDLKLLSSKPHSRELLHFHRYWAYFLYSYIYMYIFLIQCPIKVTMGLLSKIYLKLLKVQSSICKYNILSSYDVKFIFLYRSPWKHLETHSIAWT